MVCQRNQVSMDLLALHFGKVSPNFDSQIPQILHEECMWNHHLSSPFGFGRPETIFLGNARVKLTCNYMQIGLDSTAISSLDDLAILQLLTGTVRLPIQARPPKHACVSRTFPPIHSCTREQHGWLIRPGSLRKSSQVGQRHILDETILDF